MTSCPEGLASEDDAPHPFLLHYWNADCTDRHSGNWNAFTGSTGGWTGLDRRPLARSPGSRSRSSITLHHRLGHPRPRRVGRRREGRRRRHDDRTRRTSRPTPAAGPSAPIAGGLGRARAATGPDAARSSRRAASSRRRHGLHRASGSRASARRDRPEFMKRALKHLGVVKDNPGRRQPRPGSAAAATRRPPQASAKLKVGKQLRADRKRSREGARRLRRRRGRDVQGQGCSCSEAARQGVRREALHDRGGQGEDGQGQARSPRSRRSSARAPSGSRIKVDGPGLRGRGVRRAPEGAVLAPRSSSRAVRRTAAGSTVPPAGGRRRRGRGCHRKWEVLLSTFMSTPAADVLKPDFAASAAALHLHGGARPAARVDPRLRDQGARAARGGVGARRRSPTRCSRAWASSGCSGSPTPRSTAARAATTSATSSSPRRWRTRTPAAWRWASRSTRTWRPRRSTCSAPRSRSSATSCRRSRARRSPASGSPSPTPAPTSPASARARCATATSG